MDQRELELYIHIPFCLQKCSYCDFLSAPSTEQTRDRYMAALFAEIGEKAPEYRERNVVSLFIGGGTPSLLTGTQIRALLDVIRKNFTLDPAAEITMEANPGTVTEEKLRQYHAAGINRLSIGMQSAQESELRALGRIHDFPAFVAAYEAAVAAGFTNLNVDVMSGLPGQTLESLRDTLTKVLALHPMPQHISAYSLIVEEGTPFARMAERGELALPEEETERAMYEETIAVLGSYGFHRYEISNYALPGYECRHNIGYWIRRDYLGFGIGAASLVANRRFQNGRDLAAYLADPAGCTEDIQELTVPDRMEETMFLGLRLTRGVSYRSFYEQYGKTLSEVYGEVIRKNTQDGLLNTYRGADGEEYLALTERGLDLANYVMAQFLF